MIAAVETWCRGDDHTAGPAFSASGGPPPLPLLSLRRGLLSSSPPLPPPSKHLINSQMGRRNQLRERAKRKSLHNSSPSIAHTSGSVCDIDLILVISKGISRSKKEKGEKKEKDKIKSKEICLCVWTLTLKLISHYYHTWLESLRYHLNCECVLYVKQTDRRP